MTDILWQVREMAEAHAEAHPDCRRAMEYITARCDALLDDGK